jgi:hypothetical protein
MTGHTQKIKRDSWAWDTETASYDVDLYTSGGVVASVYVTVTHDAKPAEQWVKTFKTLDAARNYVDGLR